MLLGTGRYSFAYLAYQDLNIEKMIFIFYLSLDFSRLFSTDQLFACLLAHHSSCKAEPPSEAHLLPPGPAYEKIVVVIVIVIDSK